MNYLRASLLVFVYMTSCVPVTTNNRSENSKKVLYNDHNYEPIVGAVQIYSSDQSEPIFDDPRFYLKGNNRIRIRFDLFQTNYQYLSARLIHCNSNWTPSGLADLRFLDEYNEFTMENYQYSINTRKKYVQYETTLPIPKISGNYLLQIFRSGSVNDLVFNRRLVVFDQIAGIDQSIEASSNVRDRRTHHQLSFRINYQNNTTINPVRDFHVVLLQNQNWKSAISGLQPTRIQSDKQFLEYDPLDQSNNFPGLNEFRFFDLRTVDYRGINIESVEKTESGIYANVITDQSRSGLAYTQINQDLNGNFYLLNGDPGDDPLQSEYLTVRFELLSEPIRGNVYVMGRFNNWKKENPMRYNPEISGYQATAFLKQGFYNYLYWLESDVLPATYFEGNNYQTTNEYEILFYYRNPVNNYDELIGYQNFLSNN